jgi:hypothetical protein
MYIAPTTLAVVLYVFVLAWIVIVFSPYGLVLVPTIGRASSLIGLDE